jgi:hypothetical protein
MITLQPHDRVGCALDTDVEIYERSCESRLALNKLKPGGQPWRRHLLAAARPFNLQPPKAVQGDGQQRRMKSVSRKPEVTARIPALTGIAMPNIIVAEDQYCY